MMTADERSTGDIRSTTLERDERALICEDLESRPGEEEVVVQLFYHICKKKDR